MSDDSLEAPQDRRPSPPHGPPRLDLHVGSLSLQRGLRCRRSKLPGHSSALLRSVPIKRPKKRNRSIAQAELCLNTFRHALPNPKNAPFTTIHTTASLDWTGSIAKLSENRFGLPNHLHFQIGDLCGLDQHLREQRKTIRSALVSLRSRGTLILDDAITDVELRRRVFQTVSRQELSAQMEQLSDWVTGSQSDVFHGVVKRFYYLRQFSPVLLRTLVFQHECGRDPIKVSPIESILQYRFATVPSRAPR